MKKYKNLDLRAIRETENLDFAHFTYHRRQCSCCYGPVDLPALYWRNRKKPVEVFDANNHFLRYELDGKPFDDANMSYILFKNADNGRGCVKRDDDIVDKTYVNYQLSDAEQVRRICKLLQEQLGDEYLVVEPKNDHFCIEIRLKAKLEHEKAMKEAFK